MLALNLPTYPAKVISKEGKHQIFDAIRKRFVALTPEEWVRQHFVHYLLNEKSYPANLLANEASIKLNGMARRCDTIVYDKFLSPMMIIEYKAPSVEISNKVFDQIARYNMVLKVKYLIVSNGLNHYCCFFDEEQQSYSFLKDIPSYTDLF